MKEDRKCTDCARHPNNVKPNTIARCYTGYTANANKCAAFLPTTKLSAEQWTDLISNKRLIQKLGQCYRRSNESRSVIATLCDEYLDKSGELLGKVRGYDTQDNQPNDKMSAEDVLIELEEALFTGCYEPSERGAGYCANEESRSQALQILIEFKNQQP